MLFIFGIVLRFLFTFCKSHEETPFYTFHDCPRTQNLWNHGQTYISENLVIPCLTPESAIFGFINNQLKNRFIINYLLLIFNFRNLKNLHFLRLKSDFTKIKQTEDTLCLNDIRKQRKYFKKWGKLINLFCH